MNIPVNKLKELCNPFRRFKFNKKAIQRATPDINGDHSQKIAYFLVNDILSPIQIDVGVPYLNFYPDWMIEDGNHRFAAAILKNQEYIAADVAGQEDYINELFGRV